VVVVHLPVRYRQPQMAFVQRDHEVKTLSAQDAAESLANRVGFGCPHRCPENRNMHLFHRCVELSGEDAVPVVDHVSVANYKIGLNSGAF